MSLERRWLENVARTEVIEAAGIQPWTELPVWVPPGGEYDGLHDGNVSAALAAGLSCRPVTETIADTWAWIQAEGYPQIFARHAACAAATRAGLTAMGFRLMADPKFASNTVTSAWLPEGVEWSTFTKANQDKAAEIISSVVVMTSARREPAAGGPASCGSSCEGSMTPGCADSAACTCGP